MKLYLVLAALLGFIAWANAAEEPKRDKKDEAVELALRYLQRVQERDGTWAGVPTVQPRGLESGCGGTAPRSTALASAASRTRSSGSGFELVRLAMGVESLVNLPRRC